MLDTIKNWFNEQLFSDDVEYSASKRSFIDDAGASTLYDYLNHQAYLTDEDLFILDDGIGFGIVCDLACGIDPESLGSLEEIFQNILPQSATGQLLLVSSVKLGQFLNAYESDKKSGGPVLERIAKERVKHISSMIYECDQLTPKNFYLVASFTIPVSSRFSQQDIINARDKIKGAFVGAGINGAPLDPSLLSKIIEDLFPENISTDYGYFEWDELTPIKNQFSGFDKRMMLTSKRLDCVDTNKSCKTFTVKRFPKSKTSIWNMAGIIGDAFSGKTIFCEFAISFKFHIFDDGPDRKLAGAKAKSAQVRAKERGGVSKQALNDAHVWREVLSEFEQEHRLISTSMQVSLVSSKNIVADEADLRYIFQSKHGFVLEENTYLHMPSLLSMIPFCATEQLMKDFAKAGLCYKLWSKNVVNLLPIFGESKGTSSKKMLFLGRRGQIMFWDQFANNRGNYNVAVIGGSGSGKSVLMQECVTSSLATGGKVWVVDVGRSYYKLADILGGDFVVFSKQKSLCLNPFTSAKDDSFDSFRNFMKSFLYLMAHPGDALDPDVGWKKATFDKVVCDVWRARSNDADLQDVIDYLVGMDDPRCHDMATQLFPFGKSGAWASYFNGRANLQSNKNFIVFELEEISQDKHIQSLVFMLLINDVTEKMYLSDRKTPMTLVIDEAWDMLKGGHGGDIIESIARRARKYNGCLITGTQGIKDYGASPAARAAWENSYWQLMLSQDKSSISQAKKENLIEIDDFEEKLLKSVKTEHGKYSEVLIRGKSGEYALGRLILDKFSLNLYSTQPKDFAAYIDARKKGLSQLEAIIASN